MSRGLYNANTHARSVWVLGESNSSDKDVILGGDGDIPVKQHLVLHWSGALYPAGARRMGDFKTVGLPKAEKIHTLIQLFLVTVMRMLDRQSALFDRPAKRQKKRRGDDDDGVGGMDDGGERAIGKREYKPGCIRIYLEEVTSTRSEHVATRMHVVILGDEDSPDDFCDTLHKLLKENTERHRKQMSLSVKKRQVFTGFEKWKTVVGYEKYGELVDVYTNTRVCGDNYDALMDHSLSIVHRENPGCPLTNFTMENAIKKVARNKTVLSEQRNIEEYHPMGSPLRGGRMIRIGHFGDGAIRVLGSNMFPETFANKYRLSYQRSQNTALELKDVAILLRKTLASEGDPEDGESGVNPMILAKDDIANLCQLSETLAMRFTGTLAMVKAQITKIHSRDGYVRTVGQVRSEIREFVARAWNPDVDSNISAVGRKIFTFSQHREYEPSKDPRAQVVRMYPRKSEFGRMVQVWLANISYHFMVADAQKPIFTLMNGRLNAYDCNLGLHWNCLLMGQSSTGKSFAFDVVSDCSIDGTVTKFTRRTANADQVQESSKGENNDIIEMYEEMPKSLLQEDKFNGDQSDQFKEQLTNGRMVVKSCFIDDDGVRQQKVSTNECIGVRMGATNNPVSSVGEALRSRFQLIYFPKSKKKRKSISHMQYSQMKKDKSDEAVSDRFKNAQKEEQFRVYLYYKLSYVGILSMPTLATIREIHLRLVEGVKKFLPRSNVHARDEQRMLMHARSLVLRFACHRTFNCQGGACYGKRTFDIEDMLYVEEHANSGVAATEIAIMSFTMVCDNFLDSNLSLVLDCIKEIHTQCGGHYAERGEEQRRGGTLRTIDAPNIDYNYLRLPLSLTALCHQVSVLMRDETGCLSKQIIRAIIDDVQSTKVVSKCYVGPNGEIDEASPKVARMAAKIGNKSRDCEIHQHLFTECRENALENIIQFAMHDYSPTMELTMGSVMPSDPETFETILWRRSPGVIIEHENYLHVDARKAKILGFTDDDFRQATNASASATIVVDRPFDQLAAMDERAIPPIQALQ